MANPHDTAWVQPEGGAPPGEAAALEMVSVRVTNGNDFSIEDRHDGVPYKFSAGQALVIPGEAAWHILGWRPGISREEIFNYITQRWGWNTADMLRTGEHRKRFAKLDFAPVKYKVVASESDELAAPRPKTAANTPRPLSKRARRIHKKAAAAAAAEGAAPAAGAA